MTRPSNQASASPVDPGPAAASVIGGDPAGPRPQRVTVQRAVVADPASIPEELTEYFAGMDQRLSLASVLSREVARLARYQRVQVTEFDVPANDRERVVAAILAGGFRAVGGHFLRGDTALYKQPIGQFEALGYEAFERWAAQQPDPERDAAAMEDQVDGSIRHGVRVKAHFDQDDPKRTRQPD
jgi:hypothetical protein